MGTAQPPTRVVRLTVDDVLHDGETVLPRLGEPASPIPAPVASLLQAYIAGRANMTTATNPASRWLFPGRRAGQPCRPDHLSALLNKIGVPASAARGAAIRQLLEMPAGALGYHDKTTTRLLNEAGSQWSRYAAGDHGRSLPPPAHPQLVTVEYASPPRREPIRGDVVAEVSKLKQQRAEQAPALRHDVPHRC